MRISDSYRYANSQAAIARAQTRLAQAQQQISTGKRINAPSDAPLDAALATRLRADRDDTDRHLRSLGDAKAWLSVQDSALQSASSLLQRVNELAIQSGNASLGDGGREAIATELDGIRQQLGLIANTNYQGQSVFGSFSENAVELTADGASFLGVPGAEVQRRVSDSQVIAVNTDGNTVFGFDTGDDVFSVINRLAADVRAGDTDSVNTDREALLARTATIHDALGGVGTRAALVDSASSRHEDDKITMSARISDVEDADVAESAVKLQQASTAYEAILGMVAMSQQKSLMDFLR
jgi:flagellar hook-associated protein 3 FlgL